jgi:hypothetical protein
VGGLAERLRTLFPLQHEEPAMTQTKYVILAHNGTSHDCSRRKPFMSSDDAHFDLAELLEQGWRPVHETPLGSCNLYDAEWQAWGYSCVLIRLTKD